MDLKRTDPSIRLKPYLHFIDWDRPGVDLPVTFASEDFDLLAGQPEGKLYARKFDAEVSKELMDRIDTVILE